MCIRVMIIKSDKIFKCGLEAFNGNRKKKTYGAYCTPDFNAAFTL